MLHCNTYHFFVGTIVSEPASILRSDCNNAPMLITARFASLSEEHWGQTDDAGGSASADLGGSEVAEVGTKRSAISLCTSVDSTGIDDDEVGFTTTWAVGAIEFKPTKVPWSGVGLTFALGLGLGAGFCLGLGFGFGFDLCPLKEPEFVCVVSLPKYHSPWRTPSASLAKKSNKPRDKSNAPHGHDGHCEQEHSIRDQD